MSSSKKTIASIPLSKVRGSEFNPVTRLTNTRYMEKLRNSIAEHGQLHPVTLVEYPDGTFQIADGHRRVQALLDLGLTEVQAIVHRPESGENAQQVLNKLFVELNKSTKSFNGRDALNVALQGGPIFSPSIKSAKNQLEMLFTDPGMQDLLVKQEITTTVLNIAKKSTKYVLNGSGIGEGTPTYQRRVANHVLYLLRNPVQQPVTAYMRLNFDKDALKKAIDNNRPPPRVSSPRLIEAWQK